uniref:Uncharacterized protein n=1 Tax=Cannabis sativa TaxID=3483 RepID=A0A803QFS3_CANSA
MVRLDSATNGRNLRRPSGTANSEERELSSSVPETATESASDLPINSLFVQDIHELSPPSTVAQTLTSSNPSLKHRPLEMAMGFWPPTPYKHQREIMFRDYGLKIECGRKTKI